MRKSFFAQHDNPVCFMKTSVWARRSFTPARHPAFSDHPATVPPSSSGRQQGTPKKKGNAKYHKRSGPVATSRATINKKKTQLELAMLDGKKNMLESGATKTFKFQPQDKQTLGVASGDDVATLVESMTSDLVTLKHDQEDVGVVAVTSLSAKRQKKKRDLQNRTEALIAQRHDKAVVEGKRGSSGGPTSAAEIASDKKRWVQAFGRCNTWVESSKLLTGMLRNEVTLHPEVVEAATSVMAMSRQVDDLQLTRRELMEHVMGGSEEVDGEAVDAWPLEDDEVRSMASAMARKMKLEAPSNLSDIIRLTPPSVAQTLLPREVIPPHLGADDTLRVSNLLHQFDDLHTRKLDAEKHRQKQQKRGGNNKEAPQEDNIINDDIDLQEFEAEKRHAALQAMKSAKRAEASEEDLVDNADALRGAMRRRRLGTDGGNKVKESQTDAEMFVEENIHEQLDLENMMSHSTAHTKLQRPTLTTLANLSSMHITWQTSFKILDCAVKHNMQPTPAMYEEAIFRATKAAWVVRAMYDGSLTPLLGNSRQLSAWQAAVGAFSHSIMNGVDPTPASYALTMESMASSISDVYGTKVTAFREERIRDVWRSAVTLLTHATDAIEDDALHITGDSGAAILNSCCHLATTISNWSLALTALSKMDLNANRPTHRLLVPTGSSIVEALAACIAAERTRESELIFNAAVTLKSIQSATPDARCALLRSVHSLPQHSEHVRCAWLEQVASTILDIHEDPDSGDLLSRTELDEFGRFCNTLVTKSFAEGERPTNTWALAAKAFMMRECLPEMAIHDAVELEDGANSEDTSQLVNEQMTVEQHRANLVIHRAYAQAIAGNYKALKDFIEYEQWWHFETLKRPLHDVTFASVMLGAAARKGVWVDALSAYNQHWSHPLRHHLGDVNATAMSKQVLKSFSDPLHPELQEFLYDLKDEKPYSPSFHRDRFKQLAITTLKQRRLKELGLKGDTSKVDGDALASQWLVAVKAYCSAPTYHDVIEGSPQQPQPLPGLYLDYLKHALKVTPNSTTDGEGGFNAVLKQQPSMFLAWSDGVQKFRSGPLLAEVL